jgi:hypothetical protein
VTIHEKNPKIWGNWVRKTFGERKCEKNTGSSGESMSNCKTMGSLFESDAEKGGLNSL